MKYWIKWPLYCERKKNKTRSHIWKGSEAYPNLCIYWGWKSSQSLIHLPPPHPPTPAQRDPRGTVNNKHYYNTTSKFKMQEARIITGQLRTLTHSLDWPNGKLVWTIHRKGKTQDVNLTPHFCMSSTEFHSWKSWNFSASGASLSSRDNEGLAKPSTVVDEA